MLQRLIILMLIAMFTTGSLIACYSTGKVTGEAAEEVEEGAESFEEGYEEGKD